MPDTAPTEHEWGRYLKRLAADNKITLKELAARAGLTRQTLSEYIRDGAEGVTISIIRRIAGAGEDSFINALLAAGNVTRSIDAAIDEMPGADEFTDDERAQLRAALAGLDPEDIVVHRILYNRADLGIKIAGLRRERHLQERDRERRLEEAELRLGLLSDEAAG